MGKEKKKTRKAEDLSCPIGLTPLELLLFKNEVASSQKTPRNDKNRLLP